MRKSTCINEVSILGTVILESKVFKSVECWR